MSNLKKVKTGYITRVGLNKCVVVSVREHVRSRLLKKFVVRDVHFNVHDENNQGKVGDFVKIAETRPISATKHWILREIINNKL